MRRIVGFIRGSILREYCGAFFFFFIKLTRLFFRDLSERLNLSRDEGEKWVVNLIRETRMGADAKIDLEKVRLLSLSQHLSLY